MPEPIRKPETGLLPHRMVCEILGIPNNADVDLVLQDFPEEIADALRPTFKWVNDYYADGLWDPKLLKSLFLTSIAIVVKHYPDLVEQASKEMREGCFDEAIQTLLKFEQDFFMTDTALDLSITDDEANKGLAEIKKLHPDEKTDSLFVLKRPNRLRLENIFNLEDFSLLVQVEARRVLEKKMMEQLPKMARLSVATTARAAADKLSITQAIEANRLIRDLDAPYATRTIAALMLAGRRSGYTIMGLVNLMLAKNPKNQIQPGDSPNVRRGKSALRKAAYMALSHTYLGHKRIPHMHLLSKALQKFRQENAPSEPNLRLL